MQLSKTDHQTITSFLQAHLSLELLILFGSFANDTATKESDIDIAYLAKEALTDAERWELAQSLAVLMRRDIDLVDMRTISDVFRFEIITHGNIVFQQGDFERYLDQIYLTYLQLNDDRQEVLKAHGG